MRGASYLGTSRMGWIPKSISERRLGSREVWPGSEGSRMTAPAALTLILNAAAHAPHSQKYSVSPVSFFRLAEEMAKIFPLRK